MVGLAPNLKGLVRVTLSVDPFVKTDAVRWVVEFVLHQGVPQEQAEPEGG